MDRQEASSPSCLTMKPEIPHIHTYIHTYIYIHTDPSIHPFIQTPESLMPLGKLAKIYLSSNTKFILPFNKREVYLAN